jgi:diadenosine tetraphosphate (Ap4A) HIT family hydrolase
VSDPDAVFKTGYFTADEVLCVTRDAVVIKDRYPKARHHYLVLSRDRRLVSVYDLEKRDAHILVEIGRLGGLVVQAVV